jgi:hypothetical protein
MVTVIPGGSAGAHTVPGAIDTGDTLVAVRHMSANLTTTDADLKAEFSITAANTIDNTAGTDTTGAFLVVVWAHKD